MRDVVNAARQLNPEYPGELDYPAWLIGRNWCLPTNPRCKECYLNGVCPKIGI
jgi:endonuclease-3